MKIEIFRVITEKKIIDVGDDVIDFDTAHDLAMDMADEQGWDKDPEYEYFVEKE
tara:strand:- start:158 stop:319 length:162 start_codon:yes stop_codon:yes gene_type:complete